jgi:hypothetical protein
MLVLGTLLLAAFPMGHAQDPGKQGEPENASISDETSDVQIVTDAGSQPAPSGQYDHVDIEEAYIGDETDTTVSFSFKMMTRDTGPSPFSFVQANVYFTRAEIDYRIQALGRGCSDGENPSGMLQVWDPGVERFRTIQCLTEGRTVYDEADNRVTYVVDKQWLTDANQVPLRFGDALTEFYAEAMQTIVPGMTWLSFAPVQPNGAYAYDRAPDDGIGPEFKVVLGVTGRGHLVLESEEPMRVSNGEATTIVYQVDVFNDGAEPDEVLVTAEGVESSFEVRVPQKLTVPPGEWVSFPVILSMDFTHRHGEASTFTVRAESALDADAWSTVDLGVFWTKIPQPAGHHNEMWLHSAGLAEGDNPFETAFTTAYKFRQAWFNPMRPGEDPDPEATDEPVPAYFNRALFPGQTGSENTAVWDFPLSPGLLIGLDFDMERSASETSKFLTLITNDAPAQAAHLEVDLRYCNPDGQGEPQGGQGGGGDGFSGCQGQWMTIASGTSDTTSLSANGQKEYVVPLVIDQAADLLPYKRGAGLHLQVRLVSDTPQTLNTPVPAPELIVQESSLGLPLIEYHDPISQAFEGVGTLRLEALDDFERPVNPGRVTHFRFALTNIGSAEQEVQFELQGVNSQWAEILEGSGFTLKPDQQKNITVKVLVPEGTSPEERAELILVVQSVDDPNVVAVKKLRATVVDPKVNDVPDEAGKYSADVGATSPGVSVLVAVAAAALALTARRRRR